MGFGRIQDRLAFQAVQLGDAVMRGAATALAQLPLKTREYEVMNCIRTAGGQSQQDLSRALGLFAPGLVGVIDGLQDRQLVVRTRNLVDRRRHMLTLTEAGAALLDRADARLIELEERLFEGLTPRQRRAFTELSARATGLFGGGGHDD